MDSMELKLFSPQNDKLNMNYVKSASDPQTNELDLY